MHEYSVEFRIYGKDLDISTVSAYLGIEPSLVIQAGDRRSQTTQFENAVWAYNGYPSDHGIKRWASLEEGLTFLLEKLWPVKDKIASYKSEYELVFWCGHFQSSFDGGPTLSPRVLTLLGEFGVALFIDNYFDTEKPDEELERDHESPEV